MQKTVGVLWTKQYKKDGKDMKMLSGKLDLGAFGEVDIAIFPNEQKKEENHPDYRIMLSEPKSNNKAKETKEAAVAGNGGPQVF